MTDQELAHKVRHHDWTSYERRDLNERVELILSLKVLPQNRLTVILQTLTPIVAVTISQLVERFIKHEKI